MSYECSWEILDVLAARIAWERWAVVNTVQLLDADNTVPFIARYRKEKTNNMEPEMIRNVNEVYESLKSVQAKVVTCSKAVEKLGKLTPGLKRAFQNAQSMSEVEDLYASYKTGKRTLADKAREIGLEPCAQQLLKAPNLVNFNQFVNPSVRGLENVGYVKTGLQDILTDIISKDKGTMDQIRHLCEHADVTLESTQSKSSGKENAKEAKGKKKVSGKNLLAERYELYFNFKQRIKFVKPHQVLAINRGESAKVLCVKVVVPDWVRVRFGAFCCSRWTARDTLAEQRALITASVEQTYKKRIQPRLERQYRNELKKDAEKASIDVFASNLKNLLLVPPVRGRCVLGLDPGFHNGCKFAITSPTGKVLETGIAYLHCRMGEFLQQKQLEKLQVALLKHRCEVLAIGNGTACRETESIISNGIQAGVFSPLNVTYCIVNEAGASIYSASDEAKLEMPDIDINIRSAVSIARRLQNPLAELVKIEPRHIGVGMYQHDMPEAKLKTSLSSVVVDCVSFVGVDLNTATEPLLRQVASLDKGKAKNIISWREKNGPFINRQQLMDIKGFGKKTFEQCAGFIRILPLDSDLDSVKLEAEEMPPSDVGSRKRKQKVDAVSKKKRKLAHEVNELDMTCIHPESYAATERLLQLASLKKSQIGKASFISCMKKFIASTKIADVAVRLGVGLPTIQLIVDGLQLPVDYDMREEFEKPLFRREVTLMENLTPGMELTGRVTNTTHFGAFVDIGVGRDGLLHVSQMRQHSLEGSDAIRLGQRLTVTVQSVDIAKSRIALSLVALL